MNSSSFHKKSATTPAVTPQVRAVFMDRDGVINQDDGYVHHTSNFKFIDGVFDACRHLHALGYRLVIVTNQSGIGRGFYTESDFLALTDWMTEQFAQAGIPLAGVYYCPHQPDENGQSDCKCRKPAPGLLHQAIAELHINAESSMMIGDRWSDLEAGAAAGVQRLILIQPHQPNQPNQLNNSSTSDSTEQSKDGASKTPAWHNRVEYWSGLIDACNLVQK